MADYVELHARSAFSFLRAASFPEQLVERAAELELRGMALCDRDGLYGAPMVAQYFMARTASLSSG
jgi:error-prone DNA polymerase